MGMVIAMRLKTRIGETKSSIKNSRTSNGSTFFASLVLVLACLAGLVLTPVDFVAWVPGKTYDLSAASSGGDPVVKVSGVESFPSSGQIYMTTVGVTRADSQLNLLAALSTYWNPYRRLIPRKYVYPAGVDSKTSHQMEVQMMTSSQEYAVVAALRAANISVEEVPIITTVSETGPASKTLFAGDIVLSIGGVSVQSVDEVRKELRRHKVGDNVSIQVQRKDQKLTLEVQAVSSVQDAKIPVLGVNLGIGYRYSPQVKISLPEEVVGPSAGLAFALEIYDKITEGDLVGGAKIAATGEIWASGDVSGISGVNQKIHAANRAGVEIMFIPRVNCADLVKKKTQLRIIPVNTLNDAIKYLAILKTDSNSPEVPSC